MSDARPSQGPSQAASQVRGDDWELLVERERARAVGVEQLARGGDAPCPVCGGALAERRATFLAPALTRARDRRCQSCGLTVLAVPTGLGKFLAASAGLSCGLLGLTLLGEAGEQSALVALLMRLGGLLAFVGAAYAGLRLHASRTSTLRLRLDERRDRRLKLPLPPRPSLVQDTALTVLGYLVITTLVAEPHLIPTGSMAPTLLGAHAEVECPRCSLDVDVGLRSDRPARVPLTLTCVHCGEGWDVPRQAVRRRNGDMILVDRLSYRLRRPERFEPVVFRYPKQPGQRYIKRLVGLPGDTVVVRNGDLYVDGVLTPKPDAVQDRLWQPVFDGRYPAGPAGPLLWSVYEGAEQVWQRDPDATRFVYAPGHPEASPGWLRYFTSIREFVPYNLDQHLGSRLGSVTADLRLSARVDAEPGASAWLRIEESGERNPGQPSSRARYRITGGLSWPTEAASAQVRLSVEGGREQVSSLPGLTSGAHTLVLAVADGRVRLLIDDQLVFDDARQEQVALTTSSGAALGAEGGRVEFTEVRVERDILYGSLGGISATDPAQGPVAVPPGRYLMLGDNARNSQDSRAWGFVSEGHLLGRAVLVFWPPSSLRRVR